MQPVTIQLVTWNSAAALRTALPKWPAIDPSVAAIRVIDNASVDDSIALVKHYLPAADRIRLPVNTGFAGGHNTGFARCTTPFVLVVNPDVELFWPGVLAALDYFKNPRVGAVQGKLYRQKNTIDSAGVLLTRALNGRERGSGETDVGQYDTLTEVDAVTGACALYRLTALRQVRHGDAEVFDQGFWAYKEDVDLGWRLRRRGWRIWYVPHSMGTHARSLKAQGPFGWRLRVFDIWRRVRDPRTIFSWRNWLWMIIKNASATQVIAHSPFIISRLLVMGALTALYWPLGTVWVQAIGGAPAMIAKRYKSL